MERVTRAILMLNAAGEIAAWNGGAEQLFERSADIIGAPLAALIPGLDGAALREVARGGPTEHEAVRPGGAVVPIELEIARLEPGGMFVGIIHELSERRRPEAAPEHRLRRRAEELAADGQRMQDASRAHTEFLANMSHELRTPLNAIIGFADLLHDGLAGPIDGQQREFLGDIRASSRHLLQLIDDVLELAKIESGALEVVPEPVDLARAIGEIRDILRGTATERNIELEIQLDDDLGSVTVDPAKLRQILYNYVSNALKFTPRGGRVVIRAALAGEAFRVEVQDSGIGIASDDLRNLFQPFRQLDASTTKHYPGAGLGLALTKRLAEAHGGTIGVHSVRGAGSTFWVELPRVVVVAPSLRAAGR